MKRILDIVAVWIPGLAARLYSFGGAVEVIGVTLFAIAYLWSHTRVARLGAVAVAVSQS